MVSRWRGDGGRDQAGSVTPTTVFLWGLKRSGNHVLANWLYGNFGATEKQPLDSSDIHRQLRQGHCDPAAGVAFYNNCAQLNSRNFRLGLLRRVDFELARHRLPVTIFGIEDCQLRYAKRAPIGTGILHVLVLRDPLNNIASRLEAAKARPEVFRTDETYLDLFASYCAEFIGLTDVLGNKVVVNFNSFIGDRAYRDSIAGEIGFDNRDVLAEASDYGGSSSFSPGSGPSTNRELLTRFRQHRIPDDMFEMLLDRPVIGEACSKVFGYELADVRDGS
jgi:hypothetical protein